LGKSHDRSTFRCGSEALDRYLQGQARQDAEKRVAAPFVLLEPPERRVLGFYTLSASVITADQLPTDIARRVPRYPQLTVILLGRLAVDISRKGSVLGSLLLMDALHRGFDAAAEVAAMTIVVDAKDDAAEAFYRHFDFQPLQNRPRRWFLPMKSVASLFPS